VAQVRDKGDATSPKDTGTQGSQHQRPLAGIRQWVAQRAVHKIVHGLQRTAGTARYAWPKCVEKSPVISAPVTFPAKPPALPERIEAVLQLRD